MSGASDCRSDEGVIVGLIDGMIASARVVSRWLRENVAPSEQVSEALKDIRTDEDIALVVRTMLAAAAYPTRVPAALREWSPKTLREFLCNQQTFAPDGFTRREIQRLIDVLDLHRPLGSDGKHGRLHTPTCGCDDLPAVSR